ncbi:penicillin-binding protein 2 [Candidatus Dependentiae bacterium]|nr:penicillin-binding protein 2 [Candidatus Dependentiae bacterium]
MPSISKNRSLIVFAGFIFVYLLIVLNLYFIQIVHGTFYQDLKNRQYFITVTTMPARAPIFDRTGASLALNKESLAAFILPRELESPETLLPFLQHHFPKAYERFEQYKNHHFMYIQRRLSPEQQAAIELANIKDIKFLQEPSRYYPMPSLGQLIGITDIDNKGLFGLEMLFNEQLAGEPTTVTLARDARSSKFYFHKETTMTGRKPEPIQLTIDGTLQYLVHHELQNAVTQWQAKGGSAIVLDPQTGEILAVANVPDFDPNKPDSIDMEYANNSAIIDTYELGSVIKTFAALAALEEGATTPDEIIDCKNTRSTYIDGRKINTVYPGGKLTFSQVIEQSNNIGIAQVTKRLGTKLYDHYLRLGFGQKTHIPFPGEQKGFVNHPSQWSKQSLFSLSYGYEIRCSLIQLARAFCIIARNGQDIQLHLIHATTLLTPTVNDTRLYQPETIETLKKMLEAAAKKRRRRASPLDAYRIMSKTGTANILVDGEYNPDRNLYTCAGIIESLSSTKQPYQRVIVVLIKEVPRKNMYAATVAAPLFDIIAEKVVIHDKAL